MNVLDEIGGTGLLNVAVDVFYRRVRDDPAVAPYFAGAEMARLAAHQRAFLAAALGGPDAYTGRDLATAHAGLGIDDQAYDCVVEHLLAVLRDLRVGEPGLNAVAERLAALRDVIVVDG